MRSVPVESVMHSLLLFGIVQLPRGDSLRSGRWTRRGRRLAWEDIKSGAGNSWNLQEKWSRVHAAFPKGY